MSTSLLKRIERAADPTSSGRQFYRGEDLEAAVVDNLEKLLNTRQGSSASAPDYGTAELCELIHAFPDAIGVMQRSVKNTILKYEPRLKNVQVRPVEPEDDESGMFVCFEVTAQIVYPNGERQPFRFNTRIDESSNVKIS
ncbi:MAG: type VI secretion system baseplate subunit TssE [Polyangiaceae bacterium]